MLKKYCKSCGAATYYSAEDPDFCQKCGYSFTGISASAKREEPKVPEVVEVEEPDNVDGQPLDFTNISNLEFELGDTDTDSVDTFGSIVGTAENDPLPPMGKPQEQKSISEAEFLKQFQKEAGAIRPSESGGGKRKG